MPLTALARALVMGAALTVLAGLAGCGSEPRNQPDRTLGAVEPDKPDKPVKAVRSAVPVKPVVQGLPGMPPVLHPSDVYAADRPNRLSPVCLLYTSDAADE